MNNGATLPAAPLAKRQFTPLPKASSTFRAASPRVIGRDSIALAHNVGMAGVVHDDGPGLAIGVLDPDDAYLLVNRPKGNPVRVDRGIVVVAHP